MNLSTYLNPKFVFNLSLVAENLYLNKNYEKSKTILKNFDKNQDFYYWYRVKKEAQIISKTSNKKEALNYITFKFDKIENPNNKFIFDIANFYKNSEEYKLAIKYYSLIIDSLDEENKIKANLLYRRGGSFERLKDYTSADRDLRHSLKINPNEVSDLDAFIQEATNVNKGLTPSKRRGTKFTAGGAVNIENLNAYTQPELEAAKERAEEFIEDTFEELTGLTAAEFSLSQMIEIVESLDTKKEEEVKKTLENNDKLIRSAVKNAFEVYSSVIDKILKTGKDPFTGQPMNIDKDQKRLIKSFMEIDVNKLDNTKDALLALDALIQFATNGSTGGMGAVASTYVGSRSAELLKNEGVKATPISDVFSKLGIILNIGNAKLYKGWLEKIGTFPMFIDNMFKGLTKGTNFMKKSFIQELFNKAAEAETKLSSMLQWEPWGECGVSHIALESAPT